MSDASEYARTQLNLERERERIRVRDLLRYYKTDTTRTIATPKAVGSFLGNCEDYSVTPPSIAIASEVQNDLPDDSKLLSHDPTLTAFAQLGAFRLNCERSFISIMNHENQFILAEATRSVSLNSQTTCDVGDEVYLGARVLDMVWGVCPNTIQVFTAQDDSLNIATPNVVANQQCYVMNDMSAIEIYKTRPYIVGWPYMKFYAEVPIHSPTGHVIGTYCVVDNKPRDGLDKKGLDALNEISSAIMKHLELIQMQHNLQRAGKMVKGLGLFVEGKGTAESLFGDEGPSSTIPTPPLRATLTHRSIIQERPQAHRTGTAQTLSATSDQNASPQDGISSMAMILKSLDQKLPENAAQFSESISSLSVTGHGQKTPSSSVSALVDRPARERKLSSDYVASNHEFSSGAIEQLFSRACGMIREALDLDGVMFIDACVRDIAIDPATAVPMHPTPDPVGNPHHHLLSSELLGFSAHQDLVLSSISSSQRIPLAQSTLRGLLGKYRHGHILEFDEDGSVIPSTKSDSSFPMDSNKKQEMERLWARQLLKVCPGARSIIFIPLWDPQRDQWFAGNLAWTDNPTRTLESSDITYLAAFGSCVMSEKSRLDALTADRAKADFISSVSHELRSPLHGVLASAEALQDTSTGSAQDDMIRTIMVCGETLLDTMDQILDYAKTSLSAKRPSVKLEKVASHAPRITNLDLSHLVENVVEGVSVGHNYRRSGFGSLDSIKGHGSKASEYSVMIVLSIENQASWYLGTETGGWKRIIMNLMGNALKYTSSGFIHVTLRTNTTSMDPATSSRQVAILQIEDSGKGMSKDFLKHGLFTPFCQENNHAIGTGLGLSIVRQLVSDLGGDIDVVSEQNFGTTVNVTIPINLLNPMGQENNSLISDIRTRCRGLKLCLVGFEYYPNIEETPSGLLNAHSRCMLAVKSSFTEMAAGWFGLEVTTASSMGSTDGDILMGLRSKSEMLKYHYVPTTPLIIFQDTIAGDQIIEGPGVVRLSQPAGPHKLARVLAHCLDFRSSTSEPPSLKDTKTPRSPPVFEEIHRNLVNSHRPGTVESLPGEDTLKTLVRSRSHPPLPDSAQNKKNISTISETILDLESTKLAAPQVLPRSKVLLVEDNPINLKILVNYMKISKQEYVCAVNGLEALQKFQEKPRSFRVIFMDISMPVMDGLESSQRIRTYESENSLPRTRIVALTCFSSAEYQRDAALSGLDKSLVKPVPMKTLKPILEMDPELFDNQG